MVNVHQVCRLCMNEISFGGVDCMVLKDLRLAIKELYGFEVSTILTMTEADVNECYPWVVNDKGHNAMCKSKNIM